MSWNMKDLFSESIVDNWKEFYYFGSTIDIIGDRKVKPFKVKPSRDYILGTDGGGYYIVGETGSVEWYDTLEGVQKFFLTGLEYFGNEIIVIWEGDGEPPFIDGVIMEES